MEHNVEIENADGLGPIDLTPLWLRRLSWDALPCDAAEITHVKLGLVPAAPDQVEKDHAESHHRMKTVEPIAPAVELLSPLISRVLSNAMYNQLAEEARAALPGNVEEKFTEQNAEIIRASALVIIAQLISTGVLVYSDNIRMAI